ncbi:MAG: glycosyltransferase [Bacteroidaceae bacterium]|nr:glycosyltransferase [Bacteroidaceae bacterium]
MNVENRLPLVSILVPCYNSGSFLSEAIESCIQQSYSNWELVIVDDGSSDNSLLVAKQYENERIHVFTQPNSGACVARNKALSLAKGEFIKFLDADDILAKDCLKEQVQQIQNLRENQIPFGDYDFIDSDGHLLYQHTFHWEEELNTDQEFFFYSHWEVLISAPLHRRHFIEQIGGFDEKMPRGQEYDLHFRLANAGCEFVYCPAYTFSYRSHDSIFRISTGTKKKTFESTSYMMRMNDKFESLLLDRHGALPYKFEDAFFRFWFGRARDAYARRKKEDGDYCMKHADRYERAKTTFYKTYQLLGKVLGYVWLEKCFRLRIKMLGKDKKEEAPSGIARYI